MEEDGFIDQFVEYNTKLAEQLEVVVEDIPNLADVETEVGFHNQLVKSDREITENLVMDDLFVVGDELCIAEHLVVSNDMVGVECLAYVLKTYILLLIWSLLLLVWIH